MRVLLIKMSSMGDVFHTFPALTDAMQAIPSLQVDWVVEKAFSEIPAWHPVVNKVFPIELRQWRKQPWKNRHLISHFFAQIKAEQYDVILDAQGLLKSVWAARKAKQKTTPIVGMDWASAREPLASLFYQKKITVDKNDHAIHRLRRFMASALGYPLPSDSSIQNGLVLPPSEVLDQKGFEAQSYFIFLHGTTWDTKLWPEAYWIELAHKVVQAGYRILVPWGNEAEKARAERIVASVEHHQAWSPEQRLTLNEMAHFLQNAKQVVSVDTGLSHVAAALEIPLLVLYRVTDPKKIGALGEQVRHLASPLAERYLKKFESSEQVDLSLENISENCVISELFG